MAIANGYVTLELLQTYLGSDNATWVNDMERAVEAASRKIDRFCGRRFYKDEATSAKMFHSVDRYYANIDDIHTTTGLVVKTDENDDGTFEITWASTDYQLEPVNPPDGWPWYRLAAVGDYHFPVGGRRARLEVTADWGWDAVPADVSQVCLELAGEIFKRKDSPFGVAGFSEFGVVRVSNSDLRTLGRLSHYQLAEETVA